MQCICLVDKTVTFFSCAEPLFAKDRGIYHTMKMNAKFRLTLTVFTF